ncbi:hypothetical protein FRC03_000516 [Tulasnella sp. 419]|nr:hypothetical protein FRC03_000516 [Tulasnella sp. 419]
MPESTLLELIGPMPTQETWLENHRVQSSEHASDLGTFVSSRPSGASIYPAPEAIVRLKSTAPNPYDDEGNPTQQLQEDDALDLSQVEDILEHARGRYHGSASMRYLIKNGRDLRQDILGSDPLCKIQPDPPAVRPKFWARDIWENAAISEGDSWSLTFRFPSKGLGRSLVALFFDNFIPQFPLFDRTTYFSGMDKEEYKGNVKDASLYLLICAIGSKWSNDPRVCVPTEMSGGRLDFLSSGWKFFIQVCTLPPPSPLRAPTLKDLQIAALSSFYAASTSSPQLSWHLSGIGLRMAIDVGAHRRNGRRDHKSSRLTENERWKRAFWALTVFDKAGSTSQGWPIALHDEDFDAELPLEVDDEYLLDEAETTPIQPDGKPSKITAFVLRLKLSQILGYAHGTIYSINKSKKHFGFTGEKWHQHILAEMDSRMNKWKDSIPDYLRWNPINADSLFFMQSAILYLIYNSLQIEIHRPYTPWLPNLLPKHQHSTVSEPSRLICINAAKQIGHALPVLVSREAPIMPEPIRAAAQAGFVMVIEGLQKIRGSKDQGERRVDLEDEKETLRGCIQYLEFAGKRDIMKDLAHPTNMLDGYKSLPSTTTLVPDDTLLNADPRASGSKELTENIDFGGPHQDEEVVLIQPSPSMTTSVIEVHAKEASYSDLSSILEQQGDPIITSQGDDRTVQNAESTAAQSHRFPNHPSSQLSEEYSCGSLFDYLTQAGFSGEVNGATVSGGMNYMRHLLGNMPSVDEELMVTNMEDDHSPWAPTQQK